MLPECSVHWRSVISIGGLIRRIMRSGATDEGYCPTREHAKRNRRLRRLLSERPVGLDKTGWRLCRECTPATACEHNATQSRWEIPNIDRFLVRGGIFTPETAAIHIVTMQHEIELFRSEADRRSLVEDG